MALSVESFLGVSGPLVLFTVGTVLYTLFVFFLSKFISSNRVFELDLHQYAKSKHPLILMISRTFLWLVEFALFFPLIAFLWFAAFTVMLIIMTENIETGEILLISMAVVASVRICSYLSEEAADVLAQTIPFTVLALFFIDIHFIDWERVRQLAFELPSFWETAVYYLVFFIVLELVFRLAQVIIKKD